MAKIGPKEAHARQMREASVGRVDGIVKKLRSASVPPPTMVVANPEGLAAVMPPTRPTSRKVPLGEVIPEEIAKPPKSPAAVLTPEGQKRRGRPSLNLTPAQRVERQRAQTKRRVTKHRQKATARSWGYD